MSEVNKRRGQGKGKGKGKGEGTGKKRTLDLQPSTFDTPRYPEPIPEL